MPVLPFRDSAQAADLDGIVHNLQRLMRRIFTKPPPSLPAPLARRALEARQNTIAIPTVYQGLNSGPSPGVVVAIVLGSIAGFVLLVWLFSALSGNFSGGRTVTEEEVVVHRSRSPQPRSRRSRRSEMTSRSPRRERIIRQERIVRNSSRHAPPPRSSFVVQEERGERRVEGDDIVEVIEEESSVAPRRKSRRGSGYRRS